MEEKKCCCGHCALLWLSGFFAMPAIVHLARIIAGWPLIIAEHTFTMKESVVVIVITGVFSLVFGIIGCRLAHKKEEACCT